MDLSVRVHATGHADTFETARGVVATAVADSAERLPKETDLTVHVDWSEADHVVGMLGGVEGWTESASEILFQLNGTVDGWEDRLRAIVAHEYTHTTFFEAIAGDDTHGADGALSATWQYVLFEAQAQTVAERVYPDVRTPWRTHVDRDTVEDWWPAVRDEWLETAPETGEALFFGSEDVPQWLGYTLSYEIGEHLRTTHDVEAFPHLTAVDVVEAGDTLYA